jgi:hypothetical protein
MTVGVWPLKAIFEESSWVEGTVYEGGSFVVELSSCGGAGQQSVLFWGYLSGWLPESSSLRAGFWKGVVDASGFHLHKKHSYHNYFFI